MTRHKKLESQRLTKMKNEIKETYSYKDETGVLLYQNCRFEPKTFRQRRPDGNGSFVWNLNDTRRVLYRLQELLRADKASWVFFTEGEKDTENLRSLGLIATTAGASHSWRAEFADFLNDRKVCILPDNDTAGRNLAAKIGKDLEKGGCPELKTLELPGLKEKEDVSNWLDNGGTKQKLLELVEAETNPDILTPERMSEINPENIVWFWPNKIPSGTLTIIAGDPGSGKSFLSLYLASQVSTGGAWPDCDKPATKGSTVIISDEDDPAKVIVPRLIANKADRKKIYHISGQQGDKFFDLTLHLNRLDNCLKKIEDCRLVIIDPITAYLGKTNANSNAEVRSVLGPLASLAAERNITVIGINHFNKKAGDSYIYRGLGSTAFVAQARSAWGVMTDQDDKEQRILCLIKSNYCIEPTGLKFRIIEGEGDEYAGVVEFESNPWLGHIDDAGNDNSGRLDEASTWLSERLGTSDMLSAAVFEEGEEKDFSRNLLYRAKRKLGVKARRLGGYGEDGQWFWRLPDVE